MKFSTLILLASPALLSINALAYAAEQPTAPDAVTADTKTEMQSDKKEEKAVAKEITSAPSAAAPAEESKEAKPAPKPAPPKDYTLLKLNGQEIKLSEAEDIWKNLFPGSNAPDFNTFDENVRLNVLRGMVSERLIYQEAVKEGFNKSEEVKKRLANLERQVVLQSYLEKKTRQLVTEQQLKDAYAKKITLIKEEEEIKARHILLPNEEIAKDVYKQLKKGANFEALAKEKSTDKASAVNGGDLDYFTRERMVPEFSEAAFKLKKGEISEPVKSSFGWHVIKVEDRRKVRIPSFEEMKEELATDLSNFTLQDYIENLLKKADIKYYSPEGKERDFPRNMPKK